MSTSLPFLWFFFHPLRLAAYSIRPAQARLNSIAWAGPLHLDISWLPSLAARHAHGNKLLWRVGLGSEASIGKSAEIFAASDCPNFLSGWPVVVCGAGCVETFQLAVNYCMSINFNNFFQVATLRECHFQRPHEMWTEQAGCSGRESQLKSEMGDKGIDCWIVRRWSEGHIFQRRTNLSVEYSVLCVRIPARS